jgi:hypothetical protein
LYPPNSGKGKAYHLLQLLSHILLLSLARLGSSSSCTAYTSSYKTTSVQDYYRKAETNVHTYSSAHAHKKAVGNWQKAACKKQNPMHKHRVIYFNKNILSIPSFGATNIFYWVPCGFYFLKVHNKIRRLSFIICPFYFIVQHYSFYI